MIIVYKIYAIHTICAHWCCTYNDYPLFQQRLHTHSMTLSSWKLCTFSIVFQILQQRIQYWCNCVILLVSRARERESKSSVNLFCFWEKAYGILASPLRKCYMKLRKKREAFNNRRSKHSKQQATALQLYPNGIHSTWWLYIGTGKCEHTKRK